VNPARVRFDALEETGAIGSIPRAQEIGPAPHVG